MGRVLVADDEAKLGRLIAEALEAEGHSVKCVQGGRQALIELAAAAFDVVVTDLRMPEIDGLQVLARARESAAHPEVVLMTAYATAESAVAAMKAGAADYLIKPFSMDELRIRVRRLSGQRTAEKKSVRLIERLTPALVAASPKMKAVLEAAGRVAATDASVLLLGESGTGKSQLARFIHYSSARAAEPLAEVHCAALTQTLLESELFGHAKGAFTGADARKEGHLEGADRGTLFLDEIGEVSTATQVKLLRFLQDREFVPVGSIDPRKVDVRVVAATNRDLTAAVKAGTFREDFFYRLNVFTIEVPALRDRRDDVLPLAERILAAHGQTLSRLSKQARERLLTYSWPGNVRELENALARAVILSADGELELEDLGVGASPSAAVRADQLLGEGFNLDAFERDLIAAALDRAGGNKAAAARLLGISRRRMYSRLDGLSRKVDAEEP